MRIEANTNSEQSFICNIQETNGIVRWEYERNNKPELLLIVRTPFESVPDAAEIARLLSERDPDTNSDALIALNNTTHCKFLRVSQGISGVYNVTSAPATYTVFGCRRNDGGIVLFSERAERLHSCCVPAKLEYHVDIEDLNQKKRTGFFTSETISYRFSKITVTPNPNYIEGALYYCFEGSKLQFPISRSMLGKPFYVRWHNGKNPPMIRTRYKGYQSVKH